MNRALILRLNVGVESSRRRHGTEAADPAGEEKKTWVYIPSNEIYIFLTLGFYINFLNTKVSLESAFCLLFNLFTVVSTIEYVCTTVQWKQQ